MDGNWGHWRNVPATANAVVWYCSVEWSGAVGVGIDEGGKVTTLSEDPRRLWPEFFSVLHAHDVGQLNALRERVLTCIAQSNRNPEGVITEVCLARVAARTPDESMSKAFALLTDQLEALTAAVREYHDRMLSSNSSAGPL